MTKIDLTFSNDDSYPISEDPVRRAVNAAYEAGGGDGAAAASVVIISAEEIQQYNNTYAGKDETTDVLSFPAEDEPYAVEPGEAPYLGDILVAFPVAVTQAEARGHSHEREVQILVIHGMLHLMGYDHQNPQEQGEMKTMEINALALLGNPDEEIR